MRIIVVGAEGDIGKAVCDELGSRHAIIKASRSSGDFQVDMADRASLDAMYAKCGKVDAVISTAGNVHFGPLGKYTEETFMLGLRHKVMGQVNLVLAGLATVSDGGSFTLTSGVLDRDPIRMGTGAATANGALGGFVLGAAIDAARSSHQCCESRTSGRVRAEIWRVVPRSRARFVETGGARLCEERGRGHHRPSDHRRVVSQKS
ncbi:short chain dehydrogenase [Mesorhizobium sp. M0815]|uniref:short chain dehydrogenase n=1 Tax=Mesorhizobium sp. M0815 TaxID=2957005 RepID=UPI00333A6CA3